MVREHSLGGGEALGVLVEQDIAFVLNEFAFLEDTVHLTPAARPSLELDASLSEASAERISGFPPSDILNKQSYTRKMIVHLRMVVRDVAVNMMENMSLRDTVSGRGTNPAHDTAEATQEVAIKS